MISNAKRTTCSSASIPAMSLGALRDRDFRIVWSAVVISNVGTWMHIVVQGWLMYQLTNSALWLGLVGLMRAVPLLGFPLIGGVVADRVPRTAILYVTQTAAALMAAGLAVVTALGLVAPWHILLFAFGSAIVQAFDGPAREAMLPDLIATENMMSAVSLNSWAFNGAILIGPALAALLIPGIGIAGTVAVILFPSKVTVGRSKGILNWIRPPSMFTGTLCVFPNRS